jgi:hypothetical protein
VRSEQAPPAKVAAKALLRAQEHWMIWPFVGMLGLIAAVGGAYAADGRPRELRALRRSLELMFLTNFDNQFEAITKGER